MKTNKFTMGEDEYIEQPIVTNINNNKKHTRHHVKRRSSGRVHVTKLAPMARMNTTDSDVDIEFTDIDTTTRPVMKRTQSQKSLHRISFDRKGMTSLTPRQKSSSHTHTLQTTEDIDPPTDVIINEDPIETVSPPKQTTANPAVISHTSIAEPISQPLNATANNMIVPDTPVFPVNNTPTKERSYLKSQFIEDPCDDHKYDKHRSNSTDHSRNNRRTVHSGISRTQQKLMLQRQQAQVEDEHNPAHPRNMQRLNKEFELMGREYKNIKRYEDPMRSSLLRCMCKLKEPPHIDEVQRIQHLKTIAMTRGTSPNPPTKEANQSTLMGFAWNATALLDRMFNSTACK
ncbi:hypothetical protein BDB01DRAFT_777749 [Pilobolus umbonatus]|nr:hypothetical protein BDB01DRAFT_777749 [Pilobolus umbonatus]